MRDFEGTVSAELAQRVRAAAKELFDLIKTKKPVLGSALAMEPADEVVLYEASVKTPLGNLQLAETLPAARPPFEWLMEITSDLGDGSYFKHYLIRENDIVLAHRKLLTPIDDVEANTILSDLAAAKQEIK
jgi:hypothetical protein